MANRTRKPPRDFYKIVNFVRVVNAMEEIDQWRFSAALEVAREMHPEATSSELMGLMLGFDYPAVHLLPGTESCALELHWSVLSHVLTLMGELKNAKHVVGYERLNENTYLISLPASFVEMFD